MKHQRSGKIINIASGAGRLGSTKAVHYAAMKAALINLTKSLAKLGGRSNINVNAIAPGFIETDMIKGMLSQKRQLIESFIPLAKIGSAEDVASAVLFLATDESNYITGQTICIDGGHCVV
jgi:3-oxoacyl-[acyl-carrier protein] reductase